MPISFKCFACDKPLRVADDKKGKRIKCPACSSSVTVPDDDDDEIEEDEPVRRSQKSTKGKSKRSKAKSSRMPPVVWIGIAGVGFVAIGLLIWSMTRNRGNAAQVGQVANTQASSSSPSAVDQAAADRTQDESRLKMLGLVMHYYHDVYRQFPIADFPENFGADGKPLLSWRVHVLPYLSQLELYNQFHLKEPWDSPHNKKLLDQMPDVFRSAKTAGPNTRMLTLNGPHGLFLQRKVGIQHITDGSSNTILIVQVGPDKAVPWTKPDDIVVDPANLRAAFGKLDETFLCVMADGRVLEIDSTIDTKALAEIASANGGEVVNFPAFTKIAEARKAALEAAEKSRQPGQ